MFNHVLSIAAFGFVALVLVFAHPASPASRVAARQMAAAGKIATADVAATDTRPAAAK